jgi:hypothetical protein
MPLYIDRLDPSALFPTWRLHYTICGFSTRGLYPGDPAPGALWAGFSYEAEKGCVFCCEHYNYLFRGGVAFDLTKFTPPTSDYLLVDATLECWRQSPDDSGLVDVYVSNGDWIHGVLDDHLIPVSGLDGDYVDTIPPDPSAPPEGFGTGVRAINVTPQVVYWINGGMPNYGFCFKSPSEGDPDDQNGSSLVQFADFKLELRYLAFGDIQNPAPPKRPFRPAPQPRRPPPGLRRGRIMTAGSVHPTMAQRLSRPKQLQRSSDED